MVAKIVLHVQKGDSKKHPVAPIVRFLHLPCCRLKEDNYYAVIEHAGEVLEHQPDNVKVDRVGASAQLYVVLVLKKKGQERTICRC